MIDFYGRMRDTATGLLGRFTQGAVNIVRTEEGIADPTRPWEPPPSIERKYSVNAAVRGVSQKFVDGELITASDLQATIEAGIIVPVMGDRIEVDGTRHVIKRIVPTPAAGVAAAYTIIFAR